MSRYPCQWASDARVLSSLAMWDLSWLEVVVPSAVTALVIRVDSLFVGPYWSVSELVSGMGSLYESYGKTRSHWAMVRRFVYPAITGFAVGWIDADLGPSGAAVLGTVTALLLLWPIVFHGLPLGVARNDWLLVPLYLGFTLAFAASAMLGWFFIDYARAQGHGSALRYLKEQGLEWAITAVLGAVFIAFYGGAQSRLRERASQRRDRGYEDVAEEGE